MRTTLLALAVVTAVSADDTKPSADPKGTPLEITVTGKAKYTLDTGGKTPAEYKKQIDDAGQDPEKLPKPPAVELKVVVKNTGDKPVTVWTKGDPVVLTLKVEGDGSANVSPDINVTLDFRAPEGIAVAPGKTVEFEMKSLTTGFRGVAQYAYWTKPGEYKLTAELKTGVTPAPKGAKEQDGAGVVTLTSAAFKVTVEPKK